MQSADDDMSVLLSVFLSRPQNLPAIEHSTRKQTSQKSIQDLLAFETGLGVSGGDARVSFGESLGCGLGQADPAGRKAVGRGTGRVRAAP